jgi:hypothetical protein
VAEAGFYPQITPIHADFFFLGGALGAGTFFIRRCRRFTQISFFGGALDAGTFFIRRLRRFTQISFFGVGFSYTQAQPMFFIRRLRRLSQIFGSSRFYETRRVWFHRTGWNRCLSTLLMGPMKLVAWLTTHIYAVSFLQIVSGVFSLGAY